MELATVTIKLSGQTANTVVKHNVTPAQLAIYAFMHGEDCAHALTVTGAEPKRSIATEMDRLRMEFTSDHAVKCLNELFPGRFPQLPTTFRSIGFDPEMLGDHGAPPQVQFSPRNPAENSILQKIREGSPELRATTQGNAAVLPPVTAQQRADMLDDSGGAEDDDDDAEDNNALPDDPLDAEIQRQSNEGGKA